jgi:hypothetical protein
MELLEVNSPATRKEFLEVSVRLNRGQKAWIRPLDKDIEAVFDPKTNKAFQHGEAARWLLQDGNKTVGRVAAFINHKTALKDNDYPVGGMGFFDCINDQQAANILFKQSQNWLSERGMEAMDGPINFGERDRWWGLLVEGFDLEPVYCMPYNPPYYQALFENFGFQEYFKQLTFRRPCSHPIGAKAARKAAMLEKDPAYRFETFTFEQQDKYINAFVTVYNQSWSKITGTASLSYEKVANLFKEIKPILDPMFINFGFYNDEPIALFVQIPDFNQIVKRLNGKFGWYEKLLAAYHIYRKTNRKLYGVVFGVIPAFQGKGVDGGLVAFSSNIHYKTRRYDYIDMNWVGDFNPLMIAVCKQIGAEVRKQHVTYRKLFDPSRPFERMKPITR